MNGEKIKILVIGDNITDYYRFGKATRLCPEAPVPVIIEQKREARNGGAALVYQQLVQLTDGVQVIYGSKSEKERIFADGKLVCRLDKDSISLNRSFFRRAMELIQEKHPSAVVISDYGKGAFTRPAAKEIVRAAKDIFATVFVDAKHSWRWYKGADYFFPNQHETFSLDSFDKGIVVQKLGSEGCRVQGVTYPPPRRFEMRDTTGAGDIFLAAFVAAFITGKNDLSDCANYANLVAGISVTYLGTHAVTKEEIKEYSKGRR